MKSKLNIMKDGSLQWRICNGPLHREDGPAYISPNGRIVWCWNGRHHREDGPAQLTPEGTMFWNRHGFLHREDGPAIIHKSGIIEWWLNDSMVSFDRWLDKSTISDDIKYALILEYA